MKLSKVVKYFSLTSIFYSSVIFYIYIFTNCYITNNSNNDIIVNNGQSRTGENGNSNELISSQMITLFDYIHPIGSVHITFTPLSSISHVTYSFDNETNTIIYYWHNTVWKYMTDKAFLLNSGELDNLHETGAREVGGESKHTLTSDELPHLNYEWNGESYRLTNNEHVNVEAHRIETTTHWEPEPEGDYSIQKHYQIQFGNNIPHNNIPPYTKVYMYERIY